MKKSELLKHIGSISQIGGVRNFTFNEGIAKGVRAIQIDIGEIRLGFPRNELEARLLN